jgi:membrane protein implicated in regulation of membrane protease activity
MSVTTLVFLCIGGFSLLVLLLSLVGGAHVGHLHVHAGHHGHGSRVLSLPGIAGFVGGLGFGGAIASEELHTPLLALGIGVAVGVPLSWASGRLMAAADTMSTDGTPTSGDVVGATGVVISPVPEQGLGQVRVRFAGQPMKFNARADRPLAIGARVLVVDVLTPTSLLVEHLPEFLKDEQKEGQ